MGVQILARTTRLAEPYVIWAVCNIRIDALLLGWLVIAVILGEGAVINSVLVGLDIVPWIVPWIVLGPFHGCFLG